MKPSEIKQKARNKASQMEPITRTFHFEDKKGNPGSCQVVIPAQYFSYGITRRVAENLLKVFSDNLPFDILRPISVSEDDDWKIVGVSDLINGEHLPKHWQTFEIFLHQPFREDIPDGMFQSPKAQ